MSAALTMISIFVASFGLGFMLRCIIRRRLHNRNLSVGLLLVMLSLVLTIGGILLRGGTTG